MSELVACPKCGLSQSARHAFCARCDYSFDDAARAPGSPGSISDVPPSDVASGPLAPKPPRTLADGPSQPVTDTVEEALPDAPSWGMPGRDSKASSPGRGWGENTGRLARRTPGLGQDRGSLTRRRDGEDASDGGTPTASSAGLAAVGAGQAVPPPPPRDSLSPHPDPPLSNPGRPGSELRGRPPGSLYAEETSAPPGDPLMAALVSGDEHRAPEEPAGLEQGTPPVHALYPDGMPSDADFGIAPTPPPPDEGVSSQAVSGPRVVPPTLGRRGSSVGTARRGSVSRDPRGRRVASAPSVPGGIQPDSPSESTPAAAPPERIPTPLPPPPREPVPPPPPPAPPPLSRPAISIPESHPLPPPPPTNYSARTSAPRGRLAPKVIAVGALVILLIAAWDGWQLFGDLGSLNAVLDTPQASPALKQKLDQEITRLELSSRVERRWAVIVGAEDRYRIGVEVRDRVAGVPLTYEAEQEGTFRLGSKLATLEYFVDGGWQLDEAADTRLTEYREERERRAAPPEPPPVVPEEEPGEEAGDGVEQDGLEPAEGAGPEPAEEAPESPSENESPE